MLAITGATIYTCGPLGIIEDGVVIFDGKLIAAVGTRTDITSGAEVVHAPGLILTPGFIDPHSHIGIGWQELAGEADANESTGIINAHLRVIDSVDPRDIAFQDAVEGGVTTVAIHPGKPFVGNGTISPVAGQSMVMKTHGGIGYREVLREPAGLMLAMGEETISWMVNRRIGPVSRMGLAALLRKQFQEGKLYQAKLAAEPNAPRDLRLEAIAMVLDRKMPAHVHVHRADDILTLFDIVDEFGFDVVLHHVTEGHLVASELAARKIPCVVGHITRSRSARREFRNFSQQTAGVLAKAGVQVALMTDHPTEPVQFLPILAGDAVREGLAHDEALKAITLNAAELMGVAHRVGSLEVGKDADAVLLDGDPLEAMSRVRLVVADGKVVFDRLEGSPAKRSVA